MKTLYFNLLIILALAVGGTGCSSNDWEDVPKPIAEFLTEYFPLQAVSQCTYNGDTYHVKLRNSTGLSFDDRYKWISINGFGNTLPEVLLFDQLPPALYSYLQELSLTQSVYSVTRDNFAYSVTLLDHSVTYNISTGIVTPDVPVSTTVAQLGMKQRKI